MALIKCVECGKEISDKATACPNCGCPIATMVTPNPQQAETVGDKAASTEKPKKNKSIKPWVSIVGVVVVLAVVASVVISLLPSRFKWDDVLLKSALPEPGSEYGSLQINNADDLYLIVKNISLSEYKAYVNDCIDKGYTYVVESSASSYIAFNSAGNELELDYFEYDKALNISLDVRIAGAIKWSNSKLAALLPIPQSNVGSIVNDYTYGYEVYLGDTTNAEFDAYVSECETKGFNLNVQRQDNAFYAENELGYELIVEYYECNLVYIDLDVPEDVADDEESDDESNNTTSEQKTESNTEGATGSNDDQSTSSAENDSSATALEPYDGAVKVCQKIKSSLNNPDSLQLHEILHVTYNGCDYYYIDLSAMNRMGGYTRTRYYAMYMDGVLFKLEEMESFSYEDIIDSKFDNLEYLDVSTVESRLK